MNINHAKRVLEHQTLLYQVKEIYSIAEELELVSKRYAFTNMEPVPTILTVLVNRLYTVASTIKRENIHVDI